MLLVYFSDSGWMRPEKEKGGTLGVDVDLGNDAPPTSVPLL